MISRGLNIKDAYMRPLVQNSIILHDINNNAFELACRSVGLDPKLERSREDFEKIVNLEKQIYEIQDQNKRASIRRTRHETQKQINEDLKSIGINLN